MLRAEREVLTGGERKASFCMSLGPGEKEKSNRKDGGDGCKKETFVLLNMGDCDIYILNTFSGSFLPFYNPRKRGSYTQKDL